MRLTIQMGLDTQDPPTVLIQGTILRAGKGVINLEIKIPMLHQGIIVMEYLMQLLKRL